MGGGRRGGEGSQFTAYMALVNLANSRGQILSARLQSHYDAPTIALGTGLVIVAAIPLTILALRESRPADAGGATVPVADLETSAQVDAAPARSLTD